MERIETEYGYKKIYSNGDKLHFNHKDEFHNPNGPAVKNTYGHKEYYINGVLHNPSGPAVEWPNGSKEYYLNGVRHRSESDWGPAIDSLNGKKAYYKNGKLHNPQGPAIVTKNHKLNFLNGKYLWQE